MRCRPPTWSPRAAGDLPGRRDLRGAARRRVLARRPALASPTRSSLLALDRRGRRSTAVLRRRASDVVAFERQLRRRSAGRRAQDCSLTSSWACAFLYSREYLQTTRHAARASTSCWRCSRCSAIMVMVSAQQPAHACTSGVELLSLSLYAMVAFNRDRRVAAEAAMKYFVLGAIASGTLLYGMSMIYGITGTLELDELASTASRLGADSEPRLLFGARVHRRRRRVQVRRRAVPHVGAGRLPGRAHARDAVHRLGARRSRRSRSRCACSPKASAPLHDTGWQDMLIVARGAVARRRQRRRDRADAISSACSRIRRSRTSASSCSASRRHDARAIRPRCSTRSPTC